ncbi:MAG: hypothetical protein Q9199_000194 [Rusavskia elegans]
MPIQLPASNPSKICNLTYQCGHSRYFKIEEITSELTALQDHNGSEGSAVSFLCSDSSSSPSSPSSTSSLSSSSLLWLSSKSTQEGKDTSTMSENDLALLRVVDPEVLCPACTSTDSHWRFDLSPSGLSDDESGDGSWGLRDEDGSEARDELLECLVPADGGQEEMPGWWDLLDLDELLETDGEDDGKVSDGWEVVEPLESV